MKSVRMDNLILNMKQEETKRHMAGFEEEVAHNREMAAYRREVRWWLLTYPPLPPLPGESVNPGAQTWPPTGHIYNTSLVIF